jgi:hypothetical protein
MKISFDLDGTLIPLVPDSFPLEPQKIIHSKLGVEAMRWGTKEIFHTLRSGGHSVGIYTTSFRSRKMIQFWLWSYGVKADFIINEPMAGPQLRRLGISASKYPPAFDIDLHIDDLPGVALEGEKYGFDVHLLSPDLHNIEGILSDITNFRQPSPARSIA